MSSDTRRFEYNFETDVVMELSSEGKFDRDWISKTIGCGPQPSDSFPLCRRSHCKIRKALHVTEAKRSYTPEEYSNRIRESILLEAGERTTERTEDTIEFGEKE